MMKQHQRLFLAVTIICGCLCYASLVIIANGDENRNTSEGSDHTARRSVQITTDNTPSMILGDTPEVSSHVTLPTWILESDNQLDSVRSCQDQKEEITVVTGFFYIGKTIHRASNAERNSSVYFTWLQAYKLVLSPVIAFFDREEHCQFFRDIRSHLHPDLTRVVLVNKTDMWAFRLEERGQASKNSVQYNLKYCLVQHSKYELLAFASKTNPFCTKYMMWMDGGFFRDRVVNYSPHFSLCLPEKYDKSSIAYTEIKPRNYNQSPRDVLFSRTSHVVGSAALANVSAMNIWAEGYMDYVDYTFNEYDIIVSDQTLLYSWIHSNRTVIPVQTYTGAVGEGDEHRTLGYLCKAAGITRDKARMSRYGEELAQLLDMESTTDNKTFQPMRTV